MTVVLHLTDGGRIRVTDSLANVTTALNGATRFVTFTLAAEGPLAGTAILVNQLEVLDVVDTAVSRRALGEAMA